jgi:type I restriction enzyme S subunit
VNSYQTKTIEELKSDNKSAIAIGPFGSRMKSDCYVERGIPVIRGTNLTGTIGFTGEFVYIRKELADQLTSSNVYRGDLVFPHRGAIGEVGIISSDDPTRYVISSSLMKMTCDTRQVNPLYLFYFFRSRFGRHELLKNASQVGTPGISTPLTSLKEIEVPLPPITAQDTIAKSLSSLDKKIELNRKQNQTLEAIAQTLFKRWFVEFEFPNENGNPYKSSGGTMQPSELGEIPVGWDVKPLVDLAIIISKGTTPTQTQINTATDEPCIHFLKVKDIDDNGEINRAKLEKIPASVHTNALKRSILHEHDLLFSIAGTIGRVSVIEEDLNNSNTNQAVAFIRLAEPSLHFGLCLQHLRSARIQSDATSSIVQGVQANVSLASIGNLRIVVPGLRVLNGWNEVYNLLYEKQRINSAENRTLSTFRDTLLPKLMSGELRVA